MIETDDIDPKWGRPDATHDPYILANFKARPDDVLITTAPKAGTTWMQQILYQLKTGGDPDFDTINHVVPWLELYHPQKHWRQILQDYEHLASPRLFKTHCTAEQTPGIGTAFIILTVRDPRDCCVSFYHHIMNLTDAACDYLGLQRPTSFAAHVNNWIGYGTWYRNVKSWWPYRKHDKVLMLRYSDLKRDLSGCLDQISQFLHWEIHSNDKQRILEYCSFDWMKAHDEKFAEQMQWLKPLFKPGCFIRQGKVGSYNELMTAQLENKIIDKACAELTPECLAYLEL